MWVGSGNRSTKNKVEGLLWIVFDDALWDSSCDFPMVLTEVDEKQARYRLWRGESMNG